MVEPPHPNKPVENPANGSPDLDAIFGKKADSLFGVSPGIAVIAALAVAASAFVIEPVHHAPQPYKFGYSVNDKHGEQHRQEASDGHAVQGSYGFTDARGIHRQVNYVADKAGFRAQVKTNEPGTANQDPAAVHIISDAPYAHGGYAGVIAAPAIVAAPIGYSGVVAAPVAYAGY
ncbi:uncharacterized protein TNCT_518441 [Trichonephila clavata]|uniref:Cuticle protein 16.8 n=1 Tax=Trichonephila clavata TaxID=2740835 RepID=A0A8X6IBQ1_TRICU|nr:uncharacterized protein TNCT_518441 [Trichonephila clavata]